MDITSKQLKQIIKEELAAVNEEGYTDSQKEALNNALKKTFQRVAKLEKQVDFLMQTYRDTSKDDFDAKAAKLNKSKSDTVLEQGENND